MPYTRLAFEQQNALLRRILDRARPSGSSAKVVVFDLDGTLLDNRPRTCAILRELSREWSTVHPAESALLAKIGPEQLEYLVSDSLVRLEFSPELVAEACAYWKAHFFADDHIRFDQPLPGAVEFTVDFRCPSNETLAAMEAAIRARFGEIAARRGVGLTITTYAKAAAVPMDPGLQDALSLGVARAGANLSARRLPSGAGHDAMAMAALCPTGMLFVRNEKGISHSPLENMTEADAGIAVRVLLEAILELARRET